MHLCYLMNDEERANNRYGRNDAIVFEDDRYYMITPFFPCPYHYGVSTLNELRECWCKDALGVYLLTDRLSNDTIALLGFTDELRAIHDNKVKESFLKYIEYRKQSPQPLTLEEIKRIIPDYEMPC